MSGDEPWPASVVRGASCEAILKAGTGAVMVAVARGLSGAYDRVRAVHRPVGVVAAQALRLAALGEGRARTRALAHRGTAPRNSRKRKVYTIEYEQNNGNEDEGAGKEKETPRSRNAAPAPPVAENGV
ncbi:hypothetical protein EVAR_74382_1 [Eumeta japonica]|uniref:Uncharacterized protein n=1 Tax=Eumeta variegata TaxID=151549 RepID=A0A4C1SD26_EUMVA|nr:hypothetical protein EVAR_74382_1 [Eumeta japonica]